MAQAGKKLPVKKARTAAAREPAAQWAPMHDLQREIDRLFDEFNFGFWRAPARRSARALESLWPGEVPWAVAPAVDLVEEDKAYKITAEMPGLDEKDIEVTLSNDSLTISGEKKEEKEEKKKDYHLHERRYGSFQRRLQVPQGVDTGKVAASFQKGVLTVTLPKTAEAQKRQKKIPVKAA